MNRRIIRLLRKIPFARKTYNFALRTRAHLDYSPYLAFRESLVRGDAQDAESFRRVELKTGQVISLDLKKYPDFRLFSILSKGADYEPGTTALIKGILQPGHSFVDIGANVGYFSLIASSCVGRLGSVYAFEPGKNAFNRLVANVRLNQLTNVHPFNLAIGDKSILTTLYVDPISDDLSNTTRPTPKSELISSRTLDDVLAGKKVRLVKMDCEGCELAALRGMQGLIRTDLDLDLVVEYNPLYFTPGLYDLLASTFKVYGIPDSGRGFEPVPFASIDEINTSNIFCTRADLPPLYLTGQ
jgi:FkbM family methyltransferase